MFELIEKLSVFSDIKYYDEPHKYYVNGINYTSVTTFLHEFEEEFDDEFWSEYKAIETIMGEDFIKFKSTVGFRNVVSEFKGDRSLLPSIKNIIKKDWWLKNTHAIYEGSTLHDYIENYFLNKIFPYPKTNSDNTLIWDDIKDTYKIMENQFLNFYKDVKDSLIPVKTEFVVYDDEYKISGMLDILFWSKKLNKLVIFDWKTNTELKKENKFQKLKYPVNNLEACEFTKYSLQLHLYKHIIEKNTGLELNKDCFIVWFNENNLNYELIKCLDMTKEVKALVEYRKKQIK